MYEDSKRKAAARKNQKQIQVKEIKFRPGTDVGDYQIKLRKLTEFLQDGNKTKVTIRFRGREMAHKELGMDLLKRIEGDLEEFGAVEQFPKLEGRQMVMVLAPIKKQLNRVAECDSKFSINLDRGTDYDPKVQGWCTSI